MGSFWISDYLKGERPLLVQQLLENVWLLEQEYDPSLRKTFYTGRYPDFAPIEEGDKVPKYLVIWLDVDGQETLRFERTQL